MKIANKINFAFFIVVVLLMGVSMLIFHAAAKSNLEEAIFAHLSTTAQSRGNHIETFLEANKESIKQLSKSIVIEQFLLAGEQDADYGQKLNNALRRLETTAQVRKHIYEIFVLNKDGEIITSSDTGKIGTDRSTDIYFLGAKNGPFIKDAYCSETTGKKALAFSAPIKDSETQELLGVIAAKANLNTLDRIVTDKTGLGKTGEIYLVNKYGYMITPSRFIKDTFLKQKVDTENTKRFVEDVRKFGTEPHLHKAAVYTDYRGVKVLGTHDHIHDMQWCLCAEMDEEEALGPLAAIKLIFIVIFCAATCIVWSIGSLISRAISAPIHNLHRGAEIIGRGNLDYKVGTDSKDEIGRLSRAFDQMTEDLKETTTSIDTLNKEIAERQQAEEALKEAKERADMLAREAQEASKAKSEFLANMSHEIRTPMNAVIGFSQILAEEELTDEQKGYADIIQDSGKDLLNLIDDILDLSKVEAGKIDIEIIDCSLTELLAAIESLVGPEIKVKGLDFEVAAGDGLPTQIRTDPTRLRQCLLNLINNAIKFTEQGHVYVNVSLQEIDDKPFIRFDVEDTGIGIPEDKQKAVFEPFTQADGSTTRKFGGTGLGLSIAKELAGLLGGELTVASEVGKGSVFSLTIPAGLDVTKQPFLDRHNIAGHLPREQDGPEQQRFSGHVLVAEDSKTSQKLIKSLLARLGLDVTIAENGKEAVDKALTTRFDLIFMDIQMPKMNGYKATKMLRKKGITTPIVALTAYAMRGDDAKCIEAGCDDYMLSLIHISEPTRPY